MVEKVVSAPRNIVDLADYQRALRPRDRSATGSRRCRHCGAALLDDEVEDDCSSAGIVLPGRTRPPRRFRAD